MSFSENPEKHTSGPKGPVDFAGVIVRAEALTYQSRPTARASFSAACSASKGELLGGRTWFMEPALRNPTRSFGVPPTPVRVSAGSKGQAPLAPFEESPHRRVGFEADCNFVRLARFRVSARP